MIKEMYASCKILDVTLRDGGYRNNFCFPVEFTEKIVRGLDQAGIDYIEIGYRNGSFKLIPDIGPSGLCQRNYIEFCRKIIKNAKLTVMFHPKNIAIKEIAELKQSGVDAVRICFPIQDQENGFKALNAAKKQGLEVFVNITRVSQYKHNVVFELVEKIVDHAADVIYLADSNGSLTPKKIHFLFNYLIQRHRIKFGFHAHDNLFLAQTNAISAIESGVTFIDSSILGMGKGMGNLRTEGFISYLVSQNVKQYNLCRIFEIADYFTNNFHDKQHSLSPLDIILGVFNLSQDDASVLGEFVTIADYYEKAKQYSMKIKSHQVLSTCV